MIELINKWMIMKNQMERLNEKLIDVKVIILINKLINQKKDKWINQCKNTDQINQ